MGRQLRKTDLIPQRLLTSSAVRARQTVELVNAQFDAPSSVYIVPELYHASPQTILDVIRSQSADIDVLMIVGHNPGMESFVSMLTGEPLGIPTATIVRFDVELSRWQELSFESRCHIKDCWRPKEL